MNSLGWLSLAGSFAAILLVAIVFTNAVEWLGRVYGLSAGVVGSVFAAVGTALPEVSVAAVGILWNGGVQGAHAHDVGVGAILGAPFMLSTLTLSLVGASALAMRGGAGRMNVDGRVIGRDIAFFLPAYAIALGLAFVPWRWPHAAGALALVVSYACYVRAHARDRHVAAHAEEPLAPLYFRFGRATPTRGLVIAQLAIATLGMVGCALWFVGAVNGVATQLGASPLLVSLLVAPLATELPEKFNSIIWVKQRKDTLALANVTGALVFQATWPVALGLLFTDWSLDTAGSAGILSAFIAIASAATIFGLALWRRTLTAHMLLLGAVGYGVYLSIALRTQH